MDEEFKLREIAWLQLNRALNLFMDEEEYVTSLTLAGAAEEILGKLLRNSGQMSSAETWRDLIAAISVMDGETPNDKEIFTELNYARNSAKHVFEGQILQVTREHAIDMLHRATSNWTKLTGDQPEKFCKFYLLAFKDENA